MQLRSWLVFALLALALGFPPLSLAAPARICFREVPDCIEGRFAEYWRQNGGLPIFGFPLSAARQQAIEGHSYLVQLFERNRFEQHPEKKRPYDVLLGRLGDERLRQAGRDWTSFPKLGGAPGDLCFFSQASSHATCGDFFRYFRAHGLELDGRKGFSEIESVALFGLPISEAQRETGSDGKIYLTQWFERARFELHPENKEPYTVLLGRLGAQIGPAQASEVCAGIPPSVNASIKPNCFRGGTEVSLQATSFMPNEQVQYTIKAPDGVALPPLLATGKLPADAGGTVALTNTLPAGLPLGLYTITFEGQSSRRKGTIYFKIIG